MRSSVSKPTPNGEAAIDAAEVDGGIVFFPAGLYRCADLLTVSASGVVIRGEGPALSRVYFTRFEGPEGIRHLTFAGKTVGGTERLLVADGQPRDITVAVEDATGLAPGDDVAVGHVITDEFVAEHGMTGTWQVFNGKWQVLARREVVAVDTSADPHLVTLDVPLRSPLLLRDNASLRPDGGYLSEVGVEHLGLANAIAWDDAWSNERIHVLSLRRCKDAWVRDVASFPSPAAPTEGPGAGAHLQSGGIHVAEAKRVTVTDCVMEEVQNRGGGGCGYLFEIQISNEILTTGCVGRHGRHNFIQNFGFGVSGCVWSKCLSEQGEAINIPEYPEFVMTGYSEFHHSLATANLIEDCVFHDGWKAVNRGAESSGAGHTATEDVFWNLSGSGLLVSRQWSTGYVIGTAPELEVITALDDGPFSEEASGTEPEDWVEGVGVGAWLEPASLYEDQLARRLSH